MMRLARLVLVALSAGAGLGLALRLAPRPAPVLPDPPTVATQIREAARLETLDVTLYRKVAFAPDPSETGVWAWASFTFRNPKGRAIVFADVHLGLDLARLDATSIRVVGREAYVVLPPVVAQVELRPGETEVIGSNLDSAETAKLFELARASFEREAAASPALRDRARAAAERAVRALLRQAGFAEVHFVEALPERRAS
jgi:hypothetical protein